MSKAIAGAAMLAGVAAFLLIPGTGALMFTVAAPYIIAALGSIAASGISMEAGAIAGALTSNRGQNITTRQAAGLRQIVYGVQRIGGEIVWQSTTGNQYWQMNMIIVLATHEIHAIENLYLDGRQVHWQVGSAGNSTRNGYNFGGDADGGTYVGPGGPHYDFHTLVYCEARYGDQVDGDVIAAVAGNDPTWSTASLGNPPWLGGCAYVYLKLVYHSVTLPTMPEIKFTIHGKNTIYDPRTGTTGYTDNWALQVADVITDPVFGLGDNSVNQAQLIAAANVCDEQILTSQGYEANYAQHIHYDTSTSPGDALNMMMPSAEGRLSRIGGEWYIWPAYYQSSSYNFDASALIDVPSWTPYRSFKDLFNRVNGTYIAANFPYNTAGNLYDSNGWWNGTIANNWPFAFQPTNYPQYAQDALHGYSSDVWLAEDGGNQLPTELIQHGVISIVQAQRLAKIHLLRNRYQGTGTFPMSLAAWQMIPTSVFQFTWPALNWTNKVLEVSGLRFKCEQPKGGNDEEGGNGEQAAYALSVELTVNETDPSIYEWSESEELTPYDVPVAPVNNAYAVQAPTGVALSSTGTALVGADGVTIPRIEVTWTAPADSYVSQIQIQCKLSSSTTWLDAGQVSAAVSSAYVGNVVSGQTYDVQIRSIRSNGPQSVSAWVGVASHTVATALSMISGGSIGSISASSLSSGTLALGVLPTALARLSAGGASGLTAALGAAAQVGAGATTPTATGTGLAGAISFTTGTGTLAAGVIATLTFPSGAFTSTPNGVCAANGAPITGLSWTLTTTNLTLSCSGALTPSTAYTIEYCIS